MAWFKRLVNLTRPDRLSRELDREMEFHLAERTEDLIAKGMSPAQARREARRRFGHVPRIKERTRDVEVHAHLEAFLADVRYGARWLLKQPVFTTAAVLCLALGIGANTAVFSLLDAVVFESLPVSRPEQLVRLSVGEARYSVSNPLWEAVRDQQDVLPDVFAFSADNTVFDLEHGGEARRVAGAWVSGGFFSTLGVRPAAGRLFSPSDDVRGCPAVAVVSHGLWQREYGGAGDVLGRAISLDGHAFQIVGVVEPDFFGVEVGRSVQVYAPLCAEPVLAGGESALDERSQRFINVIGRLPRDVAVERVRSGLAAASSRVFQATLPDGITPEARRDYLAQTLDFEPASGGVSALRDRYRMPLGVLMGVAGLVLLIACANVANLLLMRATQRRHELAVRLSMGASRGRVIRQLLTESLLLAAVGALVGMVVARGGSALLVRSIRSRTNMVWLDLSLDLRVVAFASAVAAVTAALFGCAPAWRASRITPDAAMKSGGRGSVEGSSGSLLRASLLTGQVALSLVLLITAGLLLQTFRTLATQDPGFRADGVLLVRADMTAARLPEEQLRAAGLGVLGRLREIPGVRSASMSRMTPLSGGGWNGYLVAEPGAQPFPENGLIWRNAVSEGFFATMGTDLVEGRDFSAADDAGSPAVVIVNERLAHDFFGTASPLGKRFRLRIGDGASEPLEVIGVVRDAHYETLRAAAPATAYLPVAQLANITGLMQAPFFELRVDALSPALLDAVRGAALEVHPSLSLDLVTLSDQLAGSLRRERLLATLSAFFGTFALLLAGVGLYGTTAYGVARRRGEIGVRVALGATRSRILALVLREVVLVMSIGLGAGALIALGATRVVASLLYAVTPSDAPTLVVAAATLAVVASAAAAVPAWRAARTNPTDALRRD